MKIKLLLTVAAVSGLMAITAKADLMFKTAVDFANGPNNDTNAVAVLNANEGTSFTLADITTAHTDFSGSPSQAELTLSVLPGEYLIAHFGVGSGGTGNGGSYEIFQVINGETSVTFPSLGNVAGPDPFGHGGISSVVGFGGTNPPPPVPDSGTTVGLLGAALAGIEVLRRKFLK